MNRRLLPYLSALVALAASGASMAQQKPLVTVGGQTRQLPSATTLSVNPATSGAASINVPPGVAPTSPVDGDCWTTSAGYFCRISGVTVNLTTPLLSASGAGGVAGTLPLANGGTGSTTTAGARANLGASTVGSNLFTLSNPSAVTFPRFNADNSVSALDAAAFRTAIGAGTGGGSVNSVAADGGSTGLTFSGGPVTSTGTLTLGGTLAIANGGTGTTTAAGARTALGLGTAATLNTGTSGANVPLLDGTNTWSGGQTVQNNLSVTRTGAAASVLVSSDAGQGSAITLRSGSLKRWEVGKGAGAESGSDAGSDFYINRYTDAGGFINTPLAISRATGAVTLSTPLPVGSGGTGAATAATNLIFASPNGSTGAPTFRALQHADLPTWTGPGTGAVARSISSKLGDRINVKDFGAACDGATGTNSRAGIQAALDYAAGFGGTVELPAGGLCRINSSLTVAAGVALVGQGYTYNSGLAAGATNLSPMVFVDGDGAQVRNMLIVANAAGANTAGMALKTGVRTQIAFRDLYISGPCGALSLDGNLHDVQNVYVYQASCAGGAVVEIGKNTTLAGSTDIRISGLVVNAVTTASRPAQCMLIYDAGGLFITHSDMLFCAVGTAIVPGANQQVIWGTFVNTYLGDTNSTAALYITTGAASGTVKGLSFNGGWASSSGGSFNTYVANGAGGTVDGLSFTSFRSMGGSGNAFSLSNGAGSGVKNVRIDASMLCGYGTSGVFADTGVSSLQVTNSIIRPDCAGHASAGVYGVLLAGSNADVTLAGLDLRNNATAQVAGTPTGNSHAYGITSLNNTFGSKAAAATVNLDQVIDKWTLTGASTTISNLTGQWNGRSVTIVTAASQTFATGGNLCNGLTSTANVPVTALFGSTCWFLK